MTRHRFDPVALVSGLVIGTAGVIVLAGGRLVDEGRLLVPLGLVALGVALLLRSAPGSDRPEEPPGTAHRPTGPAAPGSAVAPGTPAGEPARPTDAPDAREAPSGEGDAGRAGDAGGDTGHPPDTATGGGDRQPT